MSGDAPQIHLAHQHRQAKRLPDAEAICRKILAVDPTHIESLYLLGLIASDWGAYEPGISLIQRSISLSPRPSGAMYNDLGYAQQMIGKNREALISFEQAIQVQPDFADAYTNRGAILRRLGADQEAILCYREALRLTPNNPATYYNLGNALRDLGKTTQAISSFSAALQLLATKATPLKAAIHNNLGTIYVGQGRYTQAMEQFDQAIKIAPENCETYHNYGNALRDLGRHDECLAMYKKALALKPLYPEARLAYTMAHIPLLFDHDSEMDPSRVIFERELGDLQDWFQQGRVNLGPQALGVSQPFYLAYQERNNQPLLSQYGRMCTNLMQAWANQYQISPPSIRAPGKVRVGLVSSHFHDHSVWHAIIKGWLRHFDRSKIDIHIFYLDHLIDDQTRWAEANASSFQTLPKTFEIAVQSILAKQLDILIYPEIGMTPLALKLASLRLCPFQMTSWGHPETSGLPTMDYYLSAEDFEPTEAEAYYAESLIRQPHLGCCYQPLEVPDMALDLASLGLNPDLPLLVSPGMVFKYAPAHDHVFVDIARKLGPCQIVFFIGRLEELTQNFKHRLDKAFTDAGLDPRDYCIFIPWQDRSAFYSLMRQATVFLDTIGFSGFNTAIQAIECGLPVVTREGRFMRGRLASGILRRLDLPELIAANNIAYVDKVCEIVKDSGYRTLLRNKIISLRSRLFEDRSAVDFLQDFLLKLVSKL